MLGRTLMMMMINDADQNHNYLKAIIIRVNKSSRI